MRRAQISEEVSEGESGEGGQLDFDKQSCIVLRDSFNSDRLVEENKDHPPFLCILLCINTNVNIQALERLLRFQ